MGFAYKIGTNEEVKRLLRISARYLKRSKKVRGERASAVKIENAIICSIFAAAAIEAGVNIFLKLPVLFIKDEYTQNLYGNMLNELRGMSSPRKVEMVAKYCKKLTGNKILLRKVKELFSYRNKILHVSADYVEGFGLPDNYFENIEGVHPNDIQSREISFEQLVRKTSIVFTPPSDMALRAAVEHYGIAEDFLKHLVSFEKDNK